MATNGPIVARQRLASGLQWGGGREEEGWGETETDANYPLPEEMKARKMEGGRGGGDREWEQK